MRRRFVLGVLLGLAAPPVVMPVAAAPLSQAALDEVGVTPPPGARLPHGRYVDQDGRQFRLAAAGSPATVLVFADYSCRHLCGPGVTLTAGALHDAGLKAGQDYRLVVIGMDGDGPARARAFAADLGDLAAERRAAAFLTGGPSTVAAAEAALGYRAAYDPASDQWAHDAASFVFTPDGRLSRVLPEVAVTPAMIAGALRAADRGETPAGGGALGRIVAVCYGFAAAHGVHGRAIVTLLRVAGIATVLGIALFVWRLGRRRRRSMPA